MRVVKQIRRGISKRQAQIRQAAEGPQGRHEEGTEADNKDCLLGCRRGARLHKEDDRRRVQSHVRPRDDAKVGILHEGSGGEARQQGKPQENCQVQEANEENPRRGRRGGGGRWASKTSRSSWQIRSPEGGRAGGGVCTLGRRRAAYTHNGSHTRTTVFGFATTDKGGFVKRHAAFTKEFVDFLEAVHKWFGKAMMVLDGALQHRAGIVLEALKEMNCEARLASLPSGCPDLSAIEEIWRQMKHAVLDAPTVKLHKMCEDTDRWRVESLPRLEIENHPYRKVQCWGRAGILPGGSCARLPNPSDTIMPVCPSRIRPRTIGLIHASQSGMRLKIPFQLIFGHWHDHICEKFCVLFTNFSFTACACSRSRDIRACPPPQHAAGPEAAMPSCFTGTCATRSPSRKGCHPRVDLGGAHLPPQGILPRAAVDTMVGDLDWSMFNLPDQAQEIAVEYAWKIRQDHAFGNLAHILLQHVILLVTRRIKMQGPPAQTALTVP